MTASVEQASRGIPELTLRDLHKSYGSEPALQGLTLTVEAGQIFGMIGPDGAGKSTAIRIACGLLKPSHGQALVLGVNPAVEPQRARQNIGYMPQRFSLYPDLSVGENLRFFADLYGVSPAERTRRMEGLMRFSRLGPFIKRRAGKLSGGMKQKLALMCCLIHTPRVLILDEPTTGVDPVSREEFWTLLRKLAGEGMALLVSTPYMDEAGLCDRIALMHRGNAIAVDRPSHVVNLFPHRLLEVQGADVERARRRLIEQSAGDIQVMRFGDRLHLIYDSDRQENTIQSALHGLTVKVRPIPASIEDTFIALMGR